MHRLTSQNSGRSTRAIGCSSSTCSAHSSRDINTDLHNGQSKRSNGSARDCSNTSSSVKYPSSAFLSNSAKRRIYKRQNITNKLHKLQLTLSLMLADGSISPRLILSIHERLSGPSPSLRFRGRDGGVKYGSPVLRTMIASSGISAGGRRLLQHINIYSGIKVNHRSDSKHVPCKRFPSLIELLF